MITEMAAKAREASLELARLTAEQKNRILLDMADSLDKNRGRIIAANNTDVGNAVGVIKDSLIDRLKLNESRIDLMIESLRQLAGLKDYVGEIISERTLENGLVLTEKRVPFGVIGIIYESRPNVTADVCGICLKSSSAVILKGGKEAINSNRVLVGLLSRACPVKDAFQLVESSDREITAQMMNLTGHIDLIIPRGGEGLIRFVRENSKIPVIETGTGNCHIYLDEEHDPVKALNIIINAKTQRPSVCNAAEKLLIHKNVGRDFIKKIAGELKERGVEILGCERTQKIIGCSAATEKDWHTEFLDLKIGIKIVDDAEQAIRHINKYGTRHSEAIISNSRENIDKFLNEVDAAAVYSNASTRFTDGYEYGLGTEIGISTQKLHARGPMGLKAMTTTKYIIKGDGQVRE
ncbi:TPA: glutamate-5-semialdehyde dehydrogenase [Candidatus Woesearchaeota archaeon]|nr:Gamma-glutamyl phosphate reductase [archaeon GW2011_AR15]MBS3104211.1 glutamate-5-semialdehyde dehydrogenase [Candidatus Woesearchaeota archaeon]HIH41959.1 glutamate-5-semialdehyde dehydrogenase [Candidatus Woesearchaeota archaeon]